MINKYVIGTPLDIRLNFWKKGNTGGSAKVVDVPCDISGYRRSVFYKTSKGVVNVEDSFCSGSTLTWQYKGTDQRITGIYTIVVILYNSDGSELIHQEFEGFGLIMPKYCNEPQPDRHIVRDAWVELYEFHPVIPEVSAITENWIVDGVDTGKVSRGNGWFAGTELTENNLSIQGTFSEIISRYGNILKKGDIYYNVNTSDVYRCESVTVSAIIQTSLWRKIANIKGKDFKYSDFTPEQIDGFMKPANDAAAIAREAAEKAISAAQQAKDEADKLPGIATNLQNAIDAAAATNSEIKSNESERLNSEQKRENSESTRVAAEQARASAEEARKTAENSRINKENLRINAESQRESNESERVANEAERIAAEEQRKVNESERDMQEQTRQQQEQTRQQQEAQRQQQEAQRQQEFQSAEQSRQATFSASESARDTEFQSKESQRDAAMQTISQEAQKLTELERKVGSSVEMTFSDKQGGSAGARTCAYIPIKKGEKIKVRITDIVNETGSEINIALRTSESPFSSSVIYFFTSSASNNLEIDASVPDDAPDNAYIAVVQTTANNALCSFKLTITKGLSYTASQFNEMFGNNVKFIRGVTRSNGEIRTSIYHLTSQPFLLKKGETIQVKTISDNTAVISSHNSSAVAVGDYVTPIAVIASGDLNEQTKEYTAEEDINIVISFNYQYSQPKYSIIRNNGLLVAINECLTEENSIW